MVVIASALVGRLLAEIPRWIAGRGQQARPVAPYGWAGVALVAVLVGFLIPSAISTARGTKRGIDYQRVRTKEIDRLAGVVTQLGGAGRLNACGEPLTRLEYQTILAWTLHVNVAKVGFKYGRGDPSREPARAVHAAPARRVAGPGGPPARGRAAAACPS